MLLTFNKLNLGPPLPKRFLFLAPGKTKWKESCFCSKTGFLSVTTVIDLKKTIYNMTFVLFLKPYFSPPCNRNIASCGSPGPYHFSSHPRTHAQIHWTLWFYMLQCDKIHFDLTKISHLFPLLYVSNHNSVRNVLNSLSDFVKRFLALRYDKVVFIVCVLITSSIKAFSSFLSFLVLSSLTLAS